MRDPRSHHRRRRDNSPKQFGLVVDLFPSGRSSIVRSRAQQSSKPVAHVLDDRFSLWELTLANRNSYDKGFKKPIKFHRTQIARQLQFEDLSQSAQGEVHFAVEKIISRKPNRFLDFFNKAESISPRLHQLRLLPGIGTARMWKILEARKNKRFTSVEDLKERTGLADPLGMVAQRVIDEIKEQPNHPIFVQNNADNEKRDT
ncbi:MAG: DUF655 domain-containing protein [Candidatus Hodarchaeales archaeon]